jgi:dipeptidyl aminopeptidase/acylaminoacyl peptidase
MRVFLRGRAKYLLPWSVVIVAAVSGGSSVNVTAQGPALRWDGLIELISSRYDYPPPTSTPPNPADGPSEMTRHAVSGDGRYIVFTANAPALGFYGPAVYLRDRRAGETRVLVGGTLNPASALRDAVISADGRYVAFTFCEPYLRPDQAPICDIWATDTLTYGWTPLSTGLSG